MSAAVRSTIRLTFLADLLPRGERVLSDFPIDQLIWVAREEAKGCPWKEFFAELLHFLLEDGLIRIGELAAEGFSPWTGTASEVVQLVLDDLERHSWEPKLGSRGWIANTESGNEVARLLIDCQGEPRGEGVFFRPDRHARARAARPLRGWIRRPVGGDRLGSRRLRWNSGRRVIRRRAHLEAVTVPQGCSRTEGWCRGRLVRTEPEGVSAMPARAQLATIVIDCADPDRRQSFAV
ncbi:hypothetical protein [Saccharothrix sp. NRRL B-16314]|uniref:hypothetical protein n=1 Tax=Saccharothrix sp. NRRL B-16314 TaxID=1463825 RepID=UPI0012DC9D13|nr:hypothetical protein [Saccharothrix sp. NRRL B-16314]